jgi:hypothetical protein
MEEQRQTVSPLSTASTLINSNSMNINTTCNVIEQDTIHRKKLSFSIDSILDKQQQKPLFNCSNFKIKRHQHSTPLSRIQLVQSMNYHIDTFSVNQHRSSHENGMNNNDSGIHLLLIDGSHPHKRKHSGSLSSDEHSSSAGNKHERLLNVDDDGASSDCSGLTSSDVDDDDLGSGSEDNDNHAPHNHNNSSGSSKYSRSNGGALHQYNHHGLGNHELHEIMHRKKKTRTVFSRTQIFQLETTFDRKRYLSSADRANLAQGLRLTEQQVKVRRRTWNESIDLKFHLSRFGFKIDETSE